MNLLKISRVPAVIVPPEMTIFQATEKMVKIGVGAVLVVEDNKPKGIFTERDAICRVIYERIPVDTIAVSEVMTSPVVCTSTNTTNQEALELMTSKHIRHLPLIDKKSHVLGMLSIRHLLRYSIEILADELESIDDSLFLEEID